MKGGYNINIRPGAAAAIDFLKKHVPSIESDGLKLVRYTKTELGDLAEEWDDSGFSYNFIYYNYNDGVNQTYVVLSVP